MSAFFVCKDCGKVYAWTPELDNLRVCPECCGDLRVEDEESGE